MDRARRAGRSKGSRGQLRCGCGESEGRVKERMGSQTRMRFWCREFQGPQTGRVVPGANTKWWDSRKTWKQENTHRGKEGRAGWQSPGCCDVPKTGKDWDWGIQELQDREEWAKSPFRDDLPQKTCQFSCQHEGPYTRHEDRDPGAAWTFPPPALLLSYLRNFLGLSFLQLLHWLLLVSSKRSSQISWWEEVYDGQSCRITHGAVSPEKPLPSSALQVQPLSLGAAIPHLSISPALMGEPWAPPRNVSLGNKALLVFLGKKWKTGGNPRRWGREELQRGEPGGWQMGAQLWDLRAAQGVKSKSTRILSHCWRWVCCRRGGKMGISLRDRKV